MSIKSGLHGNQPMSSLLEIIAAVTVNIGACDVYVLGLLDFNNKNSACLLGRSDTNVFNRKTKYFVKYCKALKYRFIK